MSQPSLTVALVGKPNSGKTALFNRLTGGRQKVANYPGVTVERKEGKCPVLGGRVLTLLDLPGTYSLRSRSPDEKITRDVLLGAQEGAPLPDAVICVVDATNLTLNLRLVLELKQLGMPIVVALNRMDMAERQGFTIDTEVLSRKLGVPVVATVAVARGGAEELLAWLRDFERFERSKGEGLGRVSSWEEPTPAVLRAMNQEVEAIISAGVLRKGLPPVWTQRLDGVLLHPVAGIPILLMVLFLMFQAVFSWAEAPMDGINLAVSWLGEWVGAALPESQLRSLLVDGVIAGVGSVIIFLPQILILFLFILVLEDSGYMARAAMLLDRMMGGVGLHGRAFIPLLSSFACAIPGIMAARTIDNKRDRLTTILVAPLMACSARVPVYTLIVAAFIPDRRVGVANLQGLVMFGLYAGGIMAALLVAWMIKHVFMRAEEEPLLMELPTYLWPHPRNVLLGVWERAKLFLVRAGTVILTLMIALWFLSTYPGAPEGAEEPPIVYSYAGQMGKAIEPVLRPIGFDWHIAIALVPGMAAREVAVGALGSVYALSNVEEDTSSLAESLVKQWSLPTALAFLAWYVFAPQCLSTLAVVKRETNGWRWPLVMFTYLTLLAYGAAFLTYRVALAVL